jgi:hypothetical protein
MTAPPRSRCLVGVGTKHFATDLQSASQFTTVSRRSFYSGHVAMSPSCPELVSRTGQGLVKIVDEAHLQVATKKGANSSAAQID